MGKNIVHLAEGQNFFDGPPGKHTAMMKDFGFKKSISGKAPMHKASGGKVPIPTKRPNWDEYSTRVNGPLETGMIDNDTGEIHRDNRVSENYKRPFHGQPFGEPEPDKPSKKALGGRICKAKGGMVHDDAAADKVMIKKGIRQHETQEHGGKHADIKLRRGGKPKMAKRGSKRRPPIPNPDMVPPPAPPSSALASVRPPAPDFTATAGPPPNSGITQMRRGGRC